MSNQTWPEWTDAITLARVHTLRKWHDKPVRVKVTAGLHYLSGNRRPCFTVTADITTIRRRDLGGGCCHDEIVKIWPKLAPVVALHLSDDQGVPMHAEPNGWYWLAGYYGGADERCHGGNADRQHWTPTGDFDGYRHSTPDECLKTFADHVRIPIDEARRLAAEFTKLERRPRCHRPSWLVVRQRFAAWLEEQRPRWQREADEARDVLRSYKERSTVQTA